MLAAIACACLLVSSATTSSAQDVLVRELEPPSDGLEWSSWVSDVPVVDLTGLWRFVESTSDPMVEVWRGREIIYEISQQIDRVVMTFRPESAEPNMQQYRWDGTVNSFERGEAEVRERAHWKDGGRTLEVEGRWWPTDDRSAVFRYTFHYKLESPRRLLFRPINEHGETAWRFER